MKQVYVSFILNILAICVWSTISAVSYMRNSTKIAIAASLLTVILLGILFKLVHIIYLAKKGD